MTLVEVMVSVGILLVMSIIVMESMRNAIEFNNLLSARDATVRTARIVMSTVRRELELAYLTPNRGAVATYRTVFVGEDQNPDTLYFASLAHQRMYLNSRESDQTEITIWAEQAPKDQGFGYILYHREAPRIDQYPDEQGPVMPLAYNVRSFELKYLDQVSGEWRSEWDSRSADTPYRLPRAVQVGLVLIADSLTEQDETEDMPFLTTVLLDYAGRMPNPQMPQLNVGPGNLGGFGGAGAAGLGSGLPTSGGRGNARKPGGRGRASPRGSAPPNSRAGAQDWLRNHSGRR